MSESLHVRPRAGGPSLLSAVALALALIAPAAAVAQPEIRIEPSTLYFGAATPPSAATAKAEIPAARREVPQAVREKAARPGGVRVLVRLAAPFTPEGQLRSQAQVRGQRETVARLQESVMRGLARERVRLHGRYKFIPYMALEVDAAALDRLASLPEVVSVEEDVFERPSLASSTATIGAGVAWAGGLTGSGQTIAVLDTGVDKNHPFFSSGGQNKVVSEACYSSAIDGTASLCPGGATESTAPGSAAPCTGDPDCSHGTHVAGIAAGNDGVGPNFGVARDANLIAIQVFSGNCGTGCIGAWISDQVKALERVYELAEEHDIAAVNMSLGGWPYTSRASCDAANPTRKAAIDNLRSIDIATVASSGNDWDFGVSAPACISSAVGVGATDDNDNVAVFSNIAPFLDLMAPGVSVNSSIPGGGLGNYNGTSMASPHVAGAWAVLKQAHPTATVSDILALLRNTAVPVSGFGVGGLRRINLGKAVTAGPLVTQEFTIHNDGGAVLPVLGLGLDAATPWIHWTPEAPFDVAPGSSRKVTVSVDFGAAPSGTTQRRLIVTSTDSNESPYPDAVFLVIGKEACHPLTRTHAGSGSHPVPSPLSSPGCPAGTFRAGETIQLTAVPSIGWAVESWSGTDMDAGSTLAKTLTMPAAPHAVSVTYLTPCFPLTLGHTGSGADPVAAPAASPGCSTGQYKYGEPIEVTAAPARGWRVGGWNGTLDDEGRGAANQVSMPPAPSTVTVSYIEGLPSVLLVDDTGGWSTYLPWYAEAVEAAGRVYDVWEVVYQGSPSAATLAAYPRVVWITAYSGPDPNEEAALASYLNQGGSLFIDAPEYLWDRGQTPFITQYLGVASADEDWDIDTVTGRGKAFSGLGTHFLNFSYGYDDLLYPGPGAETAFESEYGSIGVSKIGPNYRTIFLGFSFTALATAEGRRDLMSAALDYLGTVFVDVERGHWAKKWVEAVYRNGVSLGCSANPRAYCPDALVTRDQMAVFLLLAKEGPGYTPPACTAAMFSDVPASSPFCPWVEELARRGVTSGCGGGKFCPQTVVTRDQMAVFLLSTLEGPGYAPPACTADSFIDVPPSSPFCPWVKELASRGITTGCSLGSYCPSNPVTRAQMAVFLVSNFELPIF